MSWNLLILAVLADAFGGLGAITCYSRTASLTTNNGAGITCGASNFCYAYTTLSGYQYAGCATSATSCSLYSYKSCAVCDSDYCNFLSISMNCYARSTSLLGNGTAVRCTSGITTCYTNKDDGEANCGNCAPSATDCTSCSTNLCNKVPSLNCYSRYISTTKSVVSCPSSSSCYSYSFGFSSYSTSYYSGCGTCSSYLYSNCRVCYSDYCNDSLAASVTRMAAGTVAAMLIVTISFNKLHLV